MSSRYVIDPDDAWFQEYGPEYPPGWDVRTYSRDLLEQRDGVTVHTWRAGAYQVRGAGPTRTFKGETAWSDAAREHSDRQLRAMRADRSARAF